MFWSLTGNNIECLYRVPPEVLILNTYLETKPIKLNLKADFKGHCEVKTFEIPSFHKCKEDNRGKAVKINLSGQWTYTKVTYQQPRERSFKKKR